MGKNITIAAWWRQLWISINFLCKKSQMAMPAWVRADVEIYICCLTRFNKQDCYLVRFDISIRKNVNESVIVSANLSLLLISDTVYVGLTYAGYLAHCLREMRLLHISWNIVYAFPVKLSSQMTASGDILYLSQVWNWWPLVTSQRWPSPLTPRDVTGAY